MSTLAASGVSGNTARKDPSSANTTTTKKGGYTQLNLQPYKRQDSKPYNKSGHGMQSLGKVVATSRRMPNPASLPSLRSEHAGNDPLVALVPTGGGGWKNSREGKENSDDNVLSDEPVAKEQEIVVAKSRERSPPPRSPGKKFKTDFPSLEEQESLTKKELEELHRRQREEGGDGGERHIPDNKPNERSWRDHDVGPHGIRGPPPAGPYNRGAPFPPAPYHPPYMMQPPPHRHGVHHYPGGPPMHGPAGTRGGHFPHPPMHFRPPFPPHNYPPVNPYEMPDLPRPPTVKADELKSMEMGDEDEGGWAGHHEEVDYTKEVVFSDSSDDETQPPTDDSKGKRKQNESVSSNKKLNRDKPNADKDRTLSDYPPTMKRLPSDHRREGQRHRGSDERERKANPEPPQHAAVPPYSYPPYSYPPYGYHHPMYGPPQGPYPIPPHGAYPPNQRLVGGHSRGGRRGYTDRDEYHSHWGHDGRHRSGRKKSTEDERPRIMTKHEERKPSKGNVSEKSAISPVECPATKTTTSVSPEVPHGHHVTFPDELEETDSTSPTPDNSSSTAAHVPARRSQQPKIMLRKMIDKESDLASDKEETGSKARPRDLKNLKTTEDDSEDTGDGSARTKHTAWSMKERGPIISPKTLYEPEGKQSAAKFKKYQAQTRETKPGKTPVDGAESATATESGDVKETVNPTETKSSRPFSPSAEKKPDQRKGHTEKTRRGEQTGRERHHPERQDSGHSLHEKEYRNKPRHRKEDSRRERDGEFTDVRVHREFVDSRSSDLNKDSSQQGCEASHRSRESSQHESEPNRQNYEQAHVYLESERLGCRSRERSGGDHNVEEHKRKRELSDRRGKPHYRDDKQAPRDKVEESVQETEGGRSSVSPVLPESSSGRQSGKHDVKTSEKSRWHDHKPTSRDTRPDVDRGRYQSDRRAGPHTQRRDDIRSGKHPSRDDTRGRDRAKYQGGKDERRTDPKRRQDKPERNRSMQPRRRDESRKETPPSGGPSAELRSKVSNEPRPAYGYTEVYDVDSGSDWDDENAKSSLEQKTDSRVSHGKVDIHPPHESRGDRKPVRGRDEHRQPRDDHRQPRDEHRQQRDEHRQQRDDHRQQRDDHRQPRDEHRQPRDDHRQQRDDHRQPRDDHRQPRDDRRPIRDDRRPPRREKGHKEDRRGRDDGRSAGRGRGGKWEESQEKSKAGQQRSQHTDGTSKEDLKRADRRIESDITEHESQGTKEKLESGLPKTDITKYDLSSIRIAIVDDIGEHDIEEGRQSPSGFVEVTSKKSQKEKIRKEKEEQRKLAEDRKKEEERKKRRQASSKPRLGSDKAAPSANKPFTAWNASTGEADLWSSDHDLHSILPTMSAAPGSHLKPNISGTSLEIGFIGDSLPHSKANVPHTAELVSSASASSIPVDVTDKSYALFDGHDIVDSLFPSSRMLEAAVESTVPSTVSTGHLGTESGSNVAATEDVEVPQSAETKINSSSNEKEFQEIPPSRGRGNTKNLPPRLKNGGPGRGRGDKSVGEDRRERRGRVGGKNEPRNHREPPHRTNPSHRGDTQGDKASQPSTSSEKNKERFYVHPRAREPTKGQRSSGEKSVPPGDSKVATASSKREGHVTDTPTDAMATGQLPTSRAGSGLAGDEQRLESGGRTPDSTVRPTSASSVHSNVEVKDQSSKESCLSVNGNGGRSKSTAVTKSFSYAQALKTSFSKSDVSTSCSKLSSRSQTPSESSSMLQVFRLDVDEDSRSSTPASGKPPSTQWEDSAPNIEYESGRASQASSNSAGSAQMFDDGKDVYESAFMSTAGEHPVTVVEKPLVKSDECSVKQSEEEVTSLQSNELSKEDDGAAKTMNPEGSSLIRDGRRINEPTEQTEVISSQKTDKTPVQGLPTKVDGEAVESETGSVADNEGTPPFKPPPEVFLNQAHLSTDAHSKQEVSVQMLPHVKPLHPPYLAQPTRSAVSHLRSVPMARGTPHSAKHTRTSDPSHPSPAYVSAYKQLQQPLLRLPQHPPPLIPQPPFTQQQLLTLLKHAAVLQQQQNHQHFILQQQVIAAAQGKFPRVDKFDSSSPASVLRSSPESPHARGVGGFIPVHQGQLKNQPLSHGAGTQAKNTSAFSPYTKQSVAAHPILSQHQHPGHFPSNVVDQNIVRKSTEPLGSHDVQEQMTDSSKSRLSIKATPFIPTSQPSSSSGSAHNSPPNTSQVLATTDVSPLPSHTAIQVSRPPGFEHTSRSSQNVHLLYHHHPNLQVRPVNFPTVAPVVRPHPLPIPTPHAMQQHMTMLAAHQQASHTAQRKSSLSQGVPLPDSHAFQIITPQTEQSKGHIPPPVRRQLSGEAGLPPGMKDSHSRKSMQPHVGEQLQVNAMTASMEIQARSMSLGGSYAVRGHLPHYNTNQPNILKLTASTNVAGKRALLPTPTAAALLPHGPPVAPPTVQSWVGAMRVPRMSTAPSAGVSFPQDQSHRTSSLYNAGYSAGQF